jgi:dTDP-4-amino-4,6-dideoxygalactose transaminase
VTTPTPRIPMLDLSSEIDELLDELESAVKRVLRSGSFILGKEVEAFEREVADYLGVEHAIGLNSGTDALVIGLRALGVGPGDEVITTAFSFFATAEAIVNVGATPVFVDVREDSFNLDPDLLEAAITQRTKAILPVHLFGNPAAMSKIMAIARSHSLKVLEDCAQSFGAVYRGDSEGEKQSPADELVGAMTGGIGNAAAFSFYPTKNLGAYGDGGMLVTSDDEVAAIARKLRNHGAPLKERYLNEMVGYNSRLDELQAAVLRVKLPHVLRWNEERRHLADRYRDALVDVPGANPPAATAGHVYHQFTVRLPEGCRNAAIQSLSASGIASAIFYPVPLHRSPAWRSDSRLARSERLAGQVLSLPIWPGLPTRSVEAVAEALSDALACA